MSIVTIRGQLGSGAEEIGEKVADRLHVDYVDREIIAKVAARIQWTKEGVADKEMPAGTIMGRIAEALAHDTRVPCVPELLSVKRPYPLQAHLSAQERLHNPLNRFTLNTACASVYSGKAFILYDDVFTTGSTVLSCINELLKLQPAKILILAFAKA